MRFSHPFICILFLFSASSFASTSGYIEKGTLWKKSELQVCFAESTKDLESTNIYLIMEENDKKVLLQERRDQVTVLSLQDHQRELIEVAVTSSFSIEKTGIHFTGFKSCSTLPNADVVIFLSGTTYPKIKNQSYLAASDIGRLKNGSINSKVSIRLMEDFFILDEKSNTSILHLLSLLGEQDPIKTEFDHFANHGFYSAVVHEFMHIAGIMHEQERSDGLKLNDQVDITKDKITSRFFKVLVESDQFFQSMAKPNEKKHYQKIGAYNPFSLMNYFQQPLQLFARKTELLCESLTKAPEATLAQDPYFQNLWKGMNHYHHKTNPPSFDSKTLSNWMCTDRTFEQWTPSSPTPGKSYLTEGDVESLAFLYLKIPILNTFIKKRDQSIRYLNTWPIYLNRYEWWPEANDD